MPANDALIAQVGPPDCAAAIFIFPPITAVNGFRIFLLRAARCIYIPLLL